MASFSELAGIIVLEERSDRKKRRIRRELERVGPFRFMDVLAFRLYYKLVLSGKDHAWEQEQIAAMKERYGHLSPDVPILRTHSPNSKDARLFISEAAPDIVLARCKTLLAKRIFTIPKHGTFVMHPGICPEYRNSHGCFWALAEDDLEKVGMTLLKIDAGVDTGPVYGYFDTPYDEVSESHIVIQHNTVLNNLDAIAAALHDIVAGNLQSTDTTGRPSATWGQPWLSRYLRWKRKARRRNL